MSDNFDRRSFIRRTSMGAAAVGALSVVGGTVFGDVASANAAAARPAARPDEGVLDGSDVIAHVVNARTGEISILAGEREIKCVDRDLAQKLIRASK